MPADTDRRRRRGVPVPETEPTNWELMRLLRNIDAQIGKLVSVDVFRAEQDHTRQQFQAMSRDLTDLKAESRGEHKRLDGRIETTERDLEGQIKAERERSDGLERAARETRNRIWLAFATAAAGAVVSIGIAIFNNVMGA